MVKTLKKFFSRTTKLIILKLGMYHQVTEYCQVCSDDNPKADFHQLYSKIKFGT